MAAVVTLAICAVLTWSVRGWRVAAPTGASQRGCCPLRGESGWAGNPGMVEQAGA